MKNWTEHKIFDKRADRDWLSSSIILPVWYTINLYLKYAQRQTESMTVHVYRPFGTQNM